MAGFFGGLEQGLAGLGTSMWQGAKNIGDFIGLDGSLGYQGTWAAAAPGVISEAGKDAVTSMPSVFNSAPATGMLNGVPVAGATKLTAGALGSNTVGSIYDVNRAVNPTDYINAGTNNLLGNYDAFNAASSVTGDAAAKAAEAANHAGLYNHLKDGLAWTGTAAGKNTLDSASKIFGAYGTYKSNSDKMKMQHAYFNRQIADDNRAQRIDDADRAAWKTGYDNFKKGVQRG